MPSIEVVFQPDGRRGMFDSGITVLMAARMLGIDLNSVCGGNGSCGKCIVQIMEGKDSFKPSSEEVHILDDNSLNMGFRLACRSVIDQDVVIFIPDESRTGTQRLQTEGLNTPVNFKPLIRILKRDKSTTILHGDKVLETLTGDHEVLGFAVDVGSTKLAGYLMDLVDGEIRAVATAINPQIPFGEDIISRISYALKNEESQNKLHVSLVDGVKRLLYDACVKAEVSTESVYELVLVGNTVMQHFILGLDTEPLSHSPFAPKSLRQVDLPSASLKLGNQRGNIHVLPLIAGFVGADCVADILATGVHKSDELCFLIDIGTNTEIVVGNKERMVACSCASGPAFEGAHIKHGMRAASGAIEAAWIDQDGLEPVIKTIDDFEPLGVCGSGLIDALSEMLRTGIIDTSGRIRTEVQSSWIRKHENVMEYVLAWKKDISPKEAISLTQLDIRELQKGKAAMFSGAQIAMKQLGVTPTDITKIFMAGAFGTYINRESAINIGMIPEFRLLDIKQVGNAAGTGARMALISERARKEAKEIAESVEYIELALQPEYNHEYLDSLLFPHLDTSLFPETFKKLEKNLVFSQVHKKLE